MECDKDIVMFGFGKRSFVVDVWLVKIEIELGSRDF